MRGSTTRKFLEKGSTIAIIKPGRPSDQSAEGAIHEIMKPFKRNVRNFVRKYMDIFKNKPKQIDQSFWSR